MSTSVIYDTNEPFEFNQLTINSPNIISGGNYFIKYSINGGPLYIQPPECKTRGNISKTAKKPYCDLMFSQENNTFIQWMEDLETHTCKMIFDNRTEWFDSEMDLADIENYFASPLKIYKSGKFYLARAFLPTRLGKVSLKIYNENKDEVSIESIMDNTNVVSILEIQGIKCSARSFQIEIEIKQLMTLKPVNLFDDCLINNNKKMIINKSQSQEVNKDLEIISTNSVADSIVVETEPSNTLEENITLEECESEKKEDNISLDEIKNTESNHLKESSNNEINDIHDFEFKVNLETLDENDSFSIKPHNDIYYERYRKAQSKARAAKNIALQAYLEAKEIKNKYQLNDIDSDDDDFFNDNDETEESIA
jgi:hypothetical protein